MLDKLKMLMSLKAWLGSRTLNVAAVLGALSTWDLAAGGHNVQSAVEFLTHTFGVMDSTAMAALVALKSVADVVLRAKTDKALKDK